MTISGFTQVSGFTQTSGKLIPETQQSETPITDHPGGAGLSSLLAFDATLSQALVPHQSIALRPLVVMDLMAQSEAQSGEDNADLVSSGDEQDQQLLDILLNLQSQHTPTQNVQSMSIASVVRDIQSRATHRALEPLLAAKENQAVSAMSLLPSGALPQEIMSSLVMVTPDSQPVNPVISESGDAAVSPMINPVANNRHDSLSPRIDSPLTLANNPKEWSQQLRTALGERLQWQIESKVQQATIRLDPPEMGKIDISVHIENGKLQVQINASQSEVYRALQQSSAELRQTLAGQSSTAVDVQVSAHSQQQQQQHSPSHHHEQPAILAAQHLEAQTGMSADDGTLLTII